VSVGVDEAVAVGVCVAVAVFVAVEVELGVAVAVGVRVALGVAVAVGVGREAKHTSTKTCVVRTSFDAATSWRTPASIVPASAHCHGRAVAGLLG
jgi:hypothetical protein